MANRTNRMKEEEKNEKTIRGLLKLAANRRCVNCNNLINRYCRIQRHDFSNAKDGYVDNCTWFAEFFVVNKGVSTQVHTQGPQYVCTNFWTFVCTNCSGVHREFTHRVKSVSMAKFASHEVQALQEGGNERARECFFKEWDPQRHSFPDSSNMDRLRDFIRHVYVERRYTGERKADRAPRAKGDREDHIENRRVESYLSASRSSSSDDRYSERRSSVGRNDRNFQCAYGERSSGYDRGDKRSPGYFEVVDDRRRDDRFGSEIQNRRSNECRFPDALKPEVRSSNHRKDQDASKSLMSRPARNVLGNEDQEIQVGESPKSNGTRAPNKSAQREKTSSSSSMVSRDDNSGQVKSVNSGSLIDFSADPEPAVATVPQQSIPQETTPPSAKARDRASFDVAVQEKAPKVAANANTLEAVLAQLLVPGPAPAGNMSTVAVSSLDSSPRNNDEGQLPMMQQQKPQQQPTKMQQQRLSMVPQQQPLLVQQEQPLRLQQQQPPTMQEQQVPTVQQQPPQLVLLQQPTAMQPLQASSYPVVDSQSADQPSNAPTVGVSNNQSSSSPPTPNIQESLIGPAGHPPQVAVTSHHESSAGVPSQPTSAENRSPGRKELPEDLFTSLYSSAPMAHPGWQRGPQIVMGYGMQYPTGGVPALSQTLKSANPFDLTNEPAPVHAPMFPSMMPQQGALPNVTAQPALLRTSSFGVPSPHWMPAQQQSYTAVVSPSPSMAQQVPSSVPHQIPNNMLSMGHQGIVRTSSEGAAFGTPGIDQHLAAKYSQPSTPNSFGSVGGNPFG